MKIVVPASGWDDYTGFVSLRDQFVKNIVILDKLDCGAPFWGRILKIFLKHR